MKIKKLLALSLALAMALALAACGGGSATTTATPTPTAAANTYELALITDIGTIDDKSFNQGAWEGLVQYAEEHNITHQYYKPTEKSDAEYLNAISLAVEGGAKLIVTPGYLFESSIYEAQTLYPDVKFVLLDGQPHTADYKTYEIKDNVYSIFYAEQQAGFLAGYAAVKDGFTKLGFQGGMAVPAVIRYGYGFVQGAEAAAKEMGLPEGSISIKYNYSGDFAATPENQTRAASWYEDGTEIIFACGGAVGNSVMAAAEAGKDKWVIGVDVDQYAESDTVISSAMKMLGTSVYNAISDFYNGSFPGGQIVTLDIAVDGVGLAMDNAKWRTFSAADYQKLHDAMVADTDGIASSILTNTVGDTDRNGTADEFSDFLVAANLKYVTITEVK